MSGDEYTRGQRQELTETALRHMLEHGETPSFRGEPYNGFCPVMTYVDRLGAVWFKLMRYDKWLAMIDDKAVRVLKTSVYLPLLQDWAAHHNHKVILMDRLNFPGQHEPERTWHYVFSENAVSARPPQTYSSHENAYWPDGTTLTTTDDGLLTVNLYDLPF